MPTFEQDFDQKMEIFVERISGEARRAAMAIALELRQRLAVATPKLSGRAAASWNAALNTADTSYKLDDYENPEGAVEDGNVNINEMKLGDKIIVSNYIPYIGLLNDGRSKKAPTGFIELTVEEVKLEVDAIINLSIRDPTTGRFR